MKWLKFGLMSGDILLNRKFRTRRAAERWGAWNADGKGEYEVVELSKVPDILETKRRNRAMGRIEPRCICEGKTAGIWHCPKHGNVSA